MPRPFTLDRDFIQEIRDLVPAEPLDEILADYDTWRNEKPTELCRKVVIELLAWQFASPVRWIETQDLLFIEEAAGGLGVERFVEIGVKSAPTVAGLATNTLKLPEYSHSTTEVLNSERDAAVLFATDTDPEPDARRRATTPAPAAEAAARRRGRRTGGTGRACRSAGGPRPDDIGFDAADATLALIALSAKMRIDQIEALDSIESITDGASSRRNQLLVDLGSELNLGAIDGAAEADLAGLKGQVTKLARTYKPYGPVLSDAINDQLRTVLGPSGKRPGAHRRAGQEDLGARRRLGQARHGRGGAGHPRGLQRPRRRPWRPARRCAGRRCDRRQGHRRRCRGGGARAGVSRSRCRRLPAAAGGVVDSAALGEFAEQVTGRDGVLASAARLILGQLGLDNPVSAPRRPPTPSSSTWSPPNSVRTGRVWWRRCSTAARRCCSTTAGPAPARTWPSCG